MEGGEKMRQPSLAPRTSVEDSRRFTLSFCESCGGTGGIKNNTRSDKCPDGAPHSPGDLHEGLSLLRTRLSLTVDTIHLTSTLPRGLSPLHIAAPSKSPYTNKPAQIAKCGHRIIFIFCCYGIDEIALRQTAQQLLQRFLRLDHTQRDLGRGGGLAGRCFE